MTLRLATTVFRGTTTLCTERSTTSWSAWARSNRLYGEMGATQPLNDVPAPGASPRGVYGALGVWLGVALGIAASGIYAHVPPWFIPLTVWTLTGTAALLVWRSAAVRRHVDAVPLSALVAFHVLRAPVGVAFLVYEARGLLTAAFAVPAGYGDIVAGVLALPAAFAAKSAGVWARRGVLFWNALALADIVLVVVTAQRILFFGEGPAGLRAFFNFPGPVVPAFVVPIVFITHALIFVRLLRRRA